MFFFAPGTVILSIILREGELCVFFLFWGDQIVLQNYSDHSPRVGHPNGDLGSGESGPFNARNIQKSGLRSIHSI